MVQIFTELPCSSFHCFLIVQGLELHHIEIKVLRNVLDTVLDTYATASFVFYALLQSCQTTKPILYLPLARGTTA